MKCPKCKTDHKAKLGLFCGCGYRFAINPKSPTTMGFTDGKLIALVRAASHNQTYHFTFSQLYAAWCRAERKRAKGSGGCFLIIAGIAGIIVGSLWSTPGTGGEMHFFVGLTVLMIFLAILQFITVFLYRPPNRKILQTALHLYQTHHGYIPKLIGEKRRLESPPPNWSEPDMYDYGVERVLIVEHDILVDLLVLNEFHSLQRTLVIGESRYPKYIQTHATRILREQPDVPVFLLHDATRQGVDMHGRVEGASRFSISSHPVVDLGLFPNDVPDMPVSPALKPKNIGFRIPVDYLTYKTLASGMAAAMADMVPLSKLLKKGNDDIAKNTYDIGWYG